MMFEKTGGGTTNATAFSGTTAMGYGSGVWRHEKVDEETGYAL
jgi:hypothetical protein